MKTSALFLVCLISFLWGVGAVSAGSVEKWNSGPNICSNAKDSPVTFENGGPAGSYPGVIPDQSGLHFSAAVPWTYWPATELGTTGPFRARGNMFASPTDSAGFSSATAGRIEFTAGTASYVSVLVSTIAPKGVILEAYDADGNRIDESGFSGPTYDYSNKAESWMTRLTVSDPAGKIAYISIRDTGSWWLIDDLCTDAPQGSKPPVNTPEFPAAVFPATLITGFILTVLFIRRSREC